MSFTMLACMVLAACQGTEEPDGYAAPADATTPADANGPLAVTPLPQAVTPASQADLPISPAVASIADPDPRGPGTAVLYEVDRALADAAVGGDLGVRISERMDLEAQALASALGGLEVQRMSEGIKITIDAGVLFDPDSDRLAPAAMDYLTRIAQRLVAFGDTDILVVGNAAGTASGADNLSRSERWAITTVEYLASEGVPRDRIAHLGRGDSDPIQPQVGGNEAAKRANERVEIAILAGSQMRAGALPEARAGP